MELEYGEQEELDGGQVHDVPEHDEQEHGVQVHGELDLGDGEGDDQHQDLALACSVVRGPARHRGYGHLTCHTSSHPPPPCPVF